LQQFTFVNHACLFLAIGQMWLLPFSRCPAAPHLSSLTWHYAVGILQTEVVVNLSQFKWRLASRTLSGHPTACSPFNLLPFWLYGYTPRSFQGENRLSPVDMMPL